METLIVVIALIFTVWKYNKDLSESHNREIKMIQDKNSEDLDMLNNKFNSVQKEMLDDLRTLAFSEPKNDTIEQHMCRKKWRDRLF